MGWTTIEGKTTNAASEVNDNFYHIRGGEMLPFSGASMNIATAKYDLGESSIYWDTIHVQNLSLDANSRLPCTWNLLASETLSDTSTSIEITGLNGDEEKIYFIVAILYATAGSNTHTATLNNDSSNNYRSIYLKGQSLASLSAVGDLAFAPFGAVTDETTTSNCTFVSGYLYAATGAERFFLLQETAGIESNRASLYIHYYTNYAILYEDTTATITSFKIECGLDSFRTYTSIHIYSMNLNENIAIGVD